MSRNQRIAILFGLACHTSFVAAIVVMWYMLFYGLTKGIVPIGGEFGRALNILLVVQFPVLHSLMLSKAGRRILLFVAPKEIAADLSSTTFALFASWQLLLIFLFWTPAPVWLAPQGGLKEMWIAMYLGSWLFLVKALYDAGLSIQSGFLGWSSVFRGCKPKYGTFARAGSFKRCRQPVYLAFALVLLTGPTWSIDHFFLTVIWVLYCFLGPLLKEARYCKIYGEGFRHYQETTPYFFPLLLRKKD